MFPVPPEETKCCVHKHFWGLHCNPSPQPGGSLTTFHCFSHQVFHNSPNMWSLQWRPSWFGQGGLTLYSRTGFSTQTGVCLPPRLPVLHTQTLASTPQFRFSTIYSVTTQTWIIIHREVQLLLKACNTAFRSGDLQTCSLSKAEDTEEGNQEALLQAEGRFCLGHLDSLGRPCPLS